MPSRARPRVVHRPILEELGDYEYGDAQKHGRRAEALVKEYLEEMEIDDRVFAAMMATPPDKITDWRIYPQFLANPDLSILRFPKSINDWLFAKCRRMGDRPRDGCMRDELHKERRNASRAMTASEPTVAQGSSVASSRGPFYIQVGAYGTQAEATSRLALVIGRAKRVLNGHEPVTMPYNATDQVWYRARFAGFTKVAARKACTRLKRQKIACVVMSAN